jgi:hypothetical protein
MGSSLFKVNPFMTLSKYFSHINFLQYSTAMEEAPVKCTTSKNLNGYEQNEQMAKWLDTFLEKHI